jgi:hypothetical protein
MADGNDDRDGTDDKDDLESDARAAERLTFFFVTYYGWVLWFAVPVALGRLHRVSTHRRKGPVGPVT